MVHSLSNETLQDKAYGAIKDAIMRNNLLPRQPLSIDELSQNLGVSPTPVREALTRLISEGLVERTPNKTACVTEIREDDVHQNYEVRQLIEPFVTAIAARKTSTTPDLQERLLKLRKSITEIKNAVGGGPLELSLRDVHRNSGLELNEIVFDALEHELLRRIFSLISDHSLRIRLFTESSSLRKEERSPIVIAGEHLEIIDALLAGDERRAKQAVEQHLNNAETRTVEVSRNHSSEAQGMLERDWQTSMNSESKKPG